MTVVDWLEPALILLLVTDLWLLSTGRTRTSIRIIAVQGIVVSALPFLVADAFTWHIAALACGSLVLKGLLFPYVLTRTARRSRAEHEPRPFIPYPAAVLLGMLLIGGSLIVGARLELPHGPVSSLVVAAPMATLFTGLAVIVTRRMALTQVIGYLAIENAIFAFGAGAVADQPLVVEFGVLLDFFAAVFVMGITIMQISREFDSIDVERFTTLRG